MLKAIIEQKEVEDVKDASRENNRPDLPGESDMGKAFTDSCRECYQKNRAADKGVVIS
jgi:hypothetical protein